MLEIVIINATSDKQGRLSQTFQSFMTEELVKKISVRSFISPNFLAKHAHSVDWSGKEGA